MADDQTGNDSGKLSWVDKFKGLFLDQVMDKEALVEVLSQAQKDQIIDSDCLSLIEGALQVADTQVREIMVPRSHMVTVSTKNSPKELLEIVVNASHSRFPVIGESNDDVVGVLLAKDLLPLLLSEDSTRFNIKDILRRPTLIPESKRLNVLLKEFQEKRNHMAIVVDEYGGVAGLVTIEDVLEQIVGEIEDEHDIDGEDFIKTQDGEHYIVKALTPIEDFNDYFYSSFSCEEYGTIGGLLLHKFGHIPALYEKIGIGPYVFKVLSADKRQIRLLEVTTSLMAKPQEDG